MSSRGLCYRLWIILLLTNGVTNTASATALDDFSFELPGGYLVLRANAEDIHIWQTVNPGDGVVTAQPGVGPLFELAMDERFFYAKNRASNENWRNPPVRVFWTIIDHMNHKTYGPFSEIEFQNKLVELGISRPIAWKSLQSAYRQAVHEGRVNMREFNLQFLVQIIFVGILCLLVSPFMALFALPVTLFGRSLKILKGKISFLKTWYVLNAIVLIMLLLSVVGQRIFLLI